MDGQPVDPSRWTQDNPYQPVVKKQDQEGKWDIIDWTALEDYQMTGVFLHALQ